MGRRLAAGVFLLGGGYFLGLWHAWEYQRKVEAAMANRRSWEEL